MGAECSRRGTKLKLLNVPSFRGKIKSLITHEFKMSEIEKAAKPLILKEAVKIVLDPKFN
nr:hypothetical protein [Candidatus Bathyarchaeota archaeon]